MAQLNFYVPEDIEEQIRSAAKKEGKSISIFLAELVKANFQAKTWSEDFFKSVHGQWAGDFSEIKRHPTQKRDDL